MKHSHLFKAFHEGLHRAHAEQMKNVANMNYILKGQDVTLTYGKYKGRLAQVQEYYFDCGKEYLRVFIYRLDDKIGFKGREKFIDDHAKEFVELEDCEFA